MPHSRSGLCGRGTRFRSVPCRLSGIFTSTPSRQLMDPRHADTSFRPEELKRNDVMRIPILSTVAVTLLLSVVPAGAATIGFENSVLHSNASASMNMLGVAFQNGHVDAVGI